MNTPSFSIAIPASIVGDVPGLQLKTYKVGQVGRAAAIYRVSKIFVYPDRSYEKQLKDVKLVALLLRYMETPQYLRRRMFPISHDLKYAGTLPPLNTRHHPTISTSGKVQDGEFREGLAIGSTEIGSLVDIGLEKPVRTKETIPEGKRMTFRVRKTSEEIQLVPADRDSLPEYWGYEVVELHQTLGAFMKRKLFDLQILTSRMGSPIFELLDEIEDRLQRARSVLVAYGSPKEGLGEIFEREGLNEAVGDYTLNMISEQGTLSVRTEEAVHATLAILNMLICRTRRKIHKT